MNAILNPFGNWDSILNYLSEILYVDVISRFCAVITLTGLFFMLIYILKNKYRGNLKVMLIIVVPLFTVSLFGLVKLYNRGYKIETLKQQGKEIIICLGEFREKNGYYPEKLTALYPDCIKEDYVKNEKVFRYKMEDKQSYIFSIKEEFMGSEHLEYSYRYQGFVFVN